MGNNLRSHIDSLLTKIAADKKAEELGQSSFPTVDDGTTGAIPTGAQEATYDRAEELTSTNVPSTEDGATTKQEKPAGEDLGIDKLTPDENQLTSEPKDKKDQEDTTGPKAVDEGAKTASALGNEILAAIQALTKTAGEDKDYSEKKDDEAKAKDEKADKDEDSEKVASEAVDRIKVAAEKAPEAFNAGYKFAAEVAAVLTQEQPAQAPENAKVASEAENAAIKVAEFLMGMDKEAGMGMDPMAAMAGAGAPEEVVPPELAAAAGEEVAPVEPSEEEVIEALMAALESEGVSEQELAAALGAEEAAAPMTEEPAPEAAPAKEEPKEEPKEEKSEEIKEAQMKIANTMVGRIQELRSKGFLK